MSDTQKAYYLYALPITAKNIEITQKTRFGRITANYALIYTDENKTPSDNAVKLEESDSGRLSANDRQWLYDCNVVIIAEQLKAKEKEICSSFSEQIDELEKRLKNEAEKQGSKE